MAESLSITTGKRLRVFELKDTSKPRRSSSEAQNRAATPSPCISILGTAVPQV
jgi:hypothetical protein